MDDLCFNLWSTVMGDVQGIFLDIVLLMIKLIFLSIIYRPQNNINLMECIKEISGRYQLWSWIIFAWYFYINLLHNGQSILKVNRAMQSWIRSTSLVSQYKLFRQKFSLKRILKHAINTTCRFSALLVHILINSRKWSHKVML